MIQPFPLCIMFVLHEKDHRGLRSEARIMRIVRVGFTRLALRDAFSEP